MADLAVILGIVAFGALSVGFIWACDRIMGPDEEPTAAAAEALASEHA